MTNLPALRRKASEATDPHELIKLTWEICLAQGKPVWAVKTEKYGFKIKRIK